MSEISQLEQDVIDHLREVISILKKRLSHQPTFSKLSPPQLNALILLEKTEFSTVTELAKQENITVQSMGSTINSLKSQGLIVANTHPNDKRRILLSLSVPCRKEISAFKQNSDLWVAEKIREKLTPSEQKALLYGVQLLEKSFSD